jgi:chromosome partitioning protein
LTRQTKKPTLRQGDDAPSLQGKKEASLLMKTVAFLSQKGGSLKTSLSVSIACAAEEQGKQALVIDLDPQATACKWGDRRKLDSPIVLDAQPARLANALEKAREGGIDLAVIDTPPRSADAALAAAKLADLIVLPCRPQMYDLETVPNTLELIATAMGSAGRVHPVLKLAVLTAVPAQGTRHEQAKSALESLGVEVCPVTIGQRTAFGDAGALGLSVLEHDKNGKAAQEVRQVYLEILRLLESVLLRSGEKPPASPATKAKRQA